MLAARRRTALVAAALSAVVALAVSACSGGAGGTPTGSTTGATTGTASAFPVTIRHAFGSTTVTSAPTRVVTWGWGSTDAAIALGVTPVAIPHQSYGGDDKGVLPWVRKALAAKGQDVPTVLPDAGQDVPYEDIAAAKPDLILAPYSGITQQQYDTMSKIAPVVAYPTTPWATPWRDVVTITGQALGRSSEAQDVLRGIDQQIADQRSAHPEFAGLSLAAVWDTGGKFYVYAPSDPRVQFMLDLGFVSAPAVDSLDTDRSAFSFTLSTERLDQLTSDVLVAYGTTPDELSTFLTSAPAQTMPQVRRGAVAQLVGAEFIASVSPPTALSLPWSLQDVVGQLSVAAKAARAAA